MKKFMATTCVLIGLMVGLLSAQEPEWNPSRVKECDRACLVGIVEGYMNAIFKHDTKVVPALAKDVRMTENTAEVGVGEGVLWRSRVEPTSFKIYVADPVAGQVAIQTRLKIQSRDALVAVRLKIDRGKILEIEQLYDRNVNEAAIPLLTTPRPGLVNDIPPNQRRSREYMTWVANSYFDALEGDNGKIAAFAEDCERHEQGYQTVHNPPPGGRSRPGPGLPDPNTPQGKSDLAFSMLTCTQQVDSKIFAYMKHIRPRRALIVDEQKGVVATFPLFVHDGTRRGEPENATPGMIQNLVTMEPFGIRDGLIHEVEVFPFVTVPYGWGNGWTIGSGR
jgi:hypothetical protein